MPSSSISWLNLASVFQTPWKLQRTIWRSLLHLQNGGSIKDASHHKKKRAQSGYSSPSANGLAFKGTKRKALRSKPSWHFKWRRFEVQPSGLAILVLHWVGNGMLKAGSRGRGGARSLMGPCPVKTKQKSKNRTISEASWLVFWGNSLLSFSLAHFPWELCEYLLEIKPV